MKDSKEQLAQLRLRALSKEYFLKQSIAEFNGQVIKLYDRGEFQKLSKFMNVPLNEIKNFNINIIRGITLGFELARKRFEHLFRANLHQVEKGKNYHHTLFYVRKIDAVFESAASGGFTPVYDYTDQVINREISEFGV